jgi:hypothetical protein
MSIDKLLENLKKDKEKNENRGAKNNRPKRMVMKDEGRYKVSILHNKHAIDGIPYEKVFLHFGFLHPNFGTPSTFRCLGKNCPLCREARQMIDEKKKDAWKYKSTPVFLYYIMDASENFKYIRLSNTAHKEVYDEIVAKASSKVNPMDPEKGRIAVISLEKDGVKNKWKCSFENEGTTIREEVLKELETAPELADVYRVYTMDELERIVAGKRLDFSYNGGLSGSKDSSESEVADEDNDSTPSTPVMKSAADTDDNSSGPAPEEEVESMEVRRARIKARLQAELKDQGDQD